jgi:hypothetical protein
MQELVAVTFHLPGAVDLTFVIEAPQVLLGLPAFRDGSLQVAQRGRERLSASTSWCRASRSLTRAANCSRARAAAA